MPNQRPHSQFDASGGVQSKTSHLLRKTNEVTASKNALFNEIIGSITRRKGYEQVGDTLQHGKDGLYGGVYRYGQNNKLIAGVNNSDDTAATLRYFDIAGHWATFLSDAAPNTRFNCVNSLEEFYVAGMSDNQTYYPLTLVKQDMTTTRDYNVYDAPKCRFIVEFQGSLVAINCEVDGVKYPNRFYWTNPATTFGGFITSVQTDQNGFLTMLRVDSVRYLKEGMQVDIYGAGSEQLKIAALPIISVDRKNNRIGFVPTQINVSDNDELWFVNRKNKLTYLWNTDYPTKTSADFKEIIASEDVETVPEFTGYGKNNGRLFLFTPDAFYKWDGANLVPVSESVGCIAHESIKNIGKWTLFLHTTGVWAYNDDTGELKLLSKPIEKYINAIKSVNYPKISAGVINRVYKLSIGEILSFSSDTTSTSTSSTSTSSTSSSTSSTSTSSTSLSASTTTSTSSTSSSTSSTSSSTSSTSTSTTTTASTKEVYRLCYDFDSNIWYPETHKREFRYQFRHRMHGYNKLYFVDDTGRMFRDDTTYKDGVDTIPFEVEWGRDNFGIGLRKNFLSVTTDAERMESVVLLASIDGGSFKNVGQVTKKVQEHVLNFGTSGYDINYKYIHNDTGPGPILNGQQTYWSAKESQGAAG